MVERSSPTVMSTYRDLLLHCLTRWSRDKMAAIFQKLHSKAFYQNENIWKLITISLQFVPKDPTDNITGSDSGLAPNTRQASILTNNGLFSWRTNASPGLNQLSRVLLSPVVHDYLGQSDIVCVSMKLIPMAIKRETANNATHTQKRKCRFLRNFRHRPHLKLSVMKISSWQGFRRNDGISMSVSNAPIRVGCDICASLSRNKMVHTCVGVS